MAPHLSDFELLTQYVNERSHDAFAAIVGRYVDLIYSAARRQLRDGHRAQDVTQQVFLVLMGKAKSIRKETVLASWLLTVTTFECRNALKSDSRRLRREQKVAQMTPEIQTHGKDNAEWEAIAPHLDAALAELSAGDRDAVVLRYLQSCSYPDAAARLGASEGSVRQRVHRGIEKMRAFLAARGVTTDSAALSAVLLNRAVQVAPPGLKTATLAATAKASAQLVATKGSATIMGTVLGKVLAVACLAGVGAMIVANRMGQRHEVVVPASPPLGNVIVRTPSGTVAPVVGAGGSVGIGGGGAGGAMQPATPIRRMFHLITAVSSDARKGTSDGNDHVGFIKAGDWLRFDNVGLGQPGSADPVTFSAVLACPDAMSGHEIQVHLDDLAGEVISTLKVQSTGGYNHFASQTAPLKNARGVHTIVVQFTGGGFNLQSVQFLQAGRSAFSQIRAQSYYAADKMVNRGEALCEIHDGAWARFDAVDFGAGADSFAVVYAVDDKHAGGAITVRLDRRDGPALCEVPVESTGDWGKYIGRFAQHPLVRGRHDVFLTFSGRGKIEYGIADVMWISFDGPGAKVPLKPAGATQPATQAARRQP
jgi:RNA polymerase sigma factor (sigma-70 family)